MSIASEISKLISNLADCYTACTNKGATLPANENLDNLANCIDSISGGGTYTGYKGYTVVGNPTISDGVISNFSYDDFVKSPICWSADDNNIRTGTFEIKLVFSITGTGTEGTDGILDTRCYRVGGANYYWNSIRITITSDRKIRFRQYDIHNSSYIFDFTGSTALNTNTKYYLKATRTISKTNIPNWDLTISTDDTTYTSYSQSRSSSSDISSMECYSGYILWGRNAKYSTTSDSYLHGTLYIGECYIKAIDELNNVEYRFGSES